MELLYNLAFQSDIFSYICRNGKLKFHTQILQSVLISWGRRRGKDSCTEVGLGRGLLLKCTYPLKEPQRYSFQSCCRSEPLLLFQGIPSLSQFAEAVTPWKKQQQWTNGQAQTGRSTRTHYVDRNMLTFEYILRFISYVLIHNCLQIYNYIYQNQDNYTHTIYLLLIIDVFSLTVNTEQYYHFSRLNSIPFCILYSILA